MTVGKDQEVTVKSKDAGGQGKVAAKVTGPSGKPVASKVDVDSHFSSRCQVICATKSMLMKIKSVVFCSGGARAEPRDQPGEVHPT